MENFDYRALEERVRRLEEKCGVEEQDLPDTLIEKLKAGGNPVRLIRRHRLLTQKELSQMTGLGENHISNIENGALFNIRTAKKLAEALKVRIDDIS